MMNIITDTDEIIADKSDLIEITSIHEPTLPSHVASRYYVEHLVAGGLTFMGLWDAENNNTFPHPMDDQSMYIISTPGTVDGQVYEAGDLTVYFAEYDIWYPISYNDLISEGISLSATQPLSMTYSPDTVSVAAATDMVIGIVSPTAPQQYFGGKKQFLALPSIPETPVLSSDAASKGYVDTQVAAGVGASLLPITYSSATGIMTFSPSDSTTIAYPFRITNTTTGVDPSAAYCTGGINIAKALIVGKTIYLRYPNTSTQTAIYASTAANTLILSSAARVYCTAYARAAAPINSVDGANKTYVDSQIATVNNDDTFYGSLTLSSSVTVNFYTNIGTHTGLVQIPFYFTKFNEKLVTIAFANKSFTAASTGMLSAAGGSIPSGYRPTSKNIYPIIVQGTDFVWGGVVSYTDGTMQIFKQPDETSFTSSRSYLLYSAQTTWITA